MNPGFDPKHMFMRSMDYLNKYTEVCKCEQCGVVGTRYYRHPYNPCPRCGCEKHPTKYVAIWVETIKVYRVPFVWWRPSTWFNKYKRSGAWVPRDVPR